MLAKVRKFLAFMIASFFGVGYMPFASGTFGSVASFLLIVPAVVVFGMLGCVAVAFVSFVIGTIATKKVLHYTEHDPSLVVIDEVCGQAISCIPLAFFVQDLGQPDFNMFCIFFFVAFVLFRLFDISKPLFIGWVDRKMKNAVGVMLDDVLAGICAGVCWSMLLVAFIYWAMSGSFIPLSLCISLFFLWFLVKVLE